MKDPEFEKLRLRAEGLRMVTATAHGGRPVISPYNDLFAMVEHCKLHAREDWHEEDGDVLWYRLPVDEPPYCGTPNSSDWPEDEGDDCSFNLLPKGYYTHWQRLPPLPKSAGEQP